MRGFSEFVRHNCSIIGIAISVIYACISPHEWWTGFWIAYAVMGILAAIVFAWCQFASSGEFSFKKVRRKSVLFLAAIWPVSTYFLFLDPFITKEFLG